VTAELSLRCHASPEVASVARRVLSALESHLAPGLMNDLRLLASELVTNSIRHAANGSAEAVGMEVSISNEVVRLEVSDPGTGFEDATPRPAADKASGWGLYLVDQLADRWGVIREHGTRVWFEIDRNPHASA